jgi:hypothetical protein
MGNRLHCVLRAVGRHCRGAQCESSSTAVQLQSLHLHKLRMQRSEVMGVFSWIKKESAAEKLIAKALVEFAEGDSKDALANLVQGVVEIADGTKAEAPLVALQTKLIALGAIPAGMAIPATVTTRPVPSTK